MNYDNNEVADINEMLAFYTDHNDSDMVRGYHGAWCRNNYNHAAHRAAVRAIINGAVPRIVYIAATEYDSVYGGVIATVEGDVYVSVGVSVAYDDEETINKYGLPCERNEHLEWRGWDCYSQQEYDVRQLEASLAERVVEHFREGFTPYCHWAA